ncbi:unnamed protein product [Blepharisma stoltei]|uniref:asparaginase n=1 Tax=Blepharisma stoltei TaxID=1481888 RepID=A0AAU9JP94_9CILI|nr:unnamed protein product [Blepharisma stoltei]
MAVFQNDVTRSIQMNVRKSKLHSTSESTILVVYTGGTIGMVKSESGYIPESNIFQNSLRSNIRFHDAEEHHRRLSHPGYSKDFFITPLSFYNKRIIYKILQMVPLLDSSCMSVRNWIQIAEVIEENYKLYDGFVILHGTDTMPYTASILSFILEDLGKPVIITGSQIPFSEIRNDAVDNLLGAITIAGHFAIPEVGLYFNNRLYRGNRTCKYDNSSFEPFKSPNMRCLIKAGINFKVNWNLIRMPHKGGKFRVHKDLDSNISVVSFSPIMTEESLLASINPHTKAIIIQTYGAGNIPDNRPELLDALKRANERGIVIVNITQCKKGGVSDSYHCGQILGRAGVISGRDMTFEAALCKLSYLLGKYPGEPEKVKSEVSKDLRGEMTIDPEEIDFSLTMKEIIKTIGNVLGIYTQQDRDDVTEEILPIIINTAAAQDNIRELTQIRHEGISLELCDYEGKTPLHVACSTGKKEIVSFLVRQEVNINSIDSQGRTPLMEAINHGHFEIARELIKFGGIISCPNEQLAPMLCYAGMRGDLNKVKILYKSGVNINVIDYDKKTVGHLAAANNHLDVIRYLKNKTDYKFDAKDNNGMTPAEIAEYKGFLEISNCIKNTDQ